MRAATHVHIASSWLHRFAKCLASGNVAATVSCLHPHGYLRDLLVFTWTPRTLHGPRPTAAYLADTLAAAAIVHVRPDARPGLAPEYGGLSDFLPLRAVSAGFAFTCAGGAGSGYFSLVACPEVGGEWRALVVMMRLEDIRGHEEIREVGGGCGEHTLAWSGVEAQRRAAIESDPDVLIIGGGQTGLNVAARFKQMRISALVVEGNRRVGDNWRKRYPTLTLHSPKKMNSMLYQAYPRTWPVFTPRDKIADWLEQYVETQDLVVWTNARPLPHPIYDGAAKRWTVVVDRGGTPVTLHPAHIVVAAGVLGAPRVPLVRDREVFRGVSLHSSEYQGGAVFAGHRVVVVGAGNTAADLCQDLVFHGARSVTMVQRSGTWVVSSSSARRLMERMYPDELGVDVCDIMAMARPLALMRKFDKVTERQMMEQERETHRGLREAGFNIVSGKNFLLR